jgi:hypothetical protein
LGGKFINLGCGGVGVTFPFPPPPPHSSLPLPPPSPLPLPPWRPSYSMSTVHGARYVTGNSERYTLNKEISLHAHSIQATSQKRTTSQQRTKAGPNNVSSICMLGGTVGPPEGHFNAQYLHVSCSVGALPAHEQGYSSSQTHSF